jgi:cbb3-type cytochrome oxidase subunit 3
MYVIPIVFIIIYLLAFVWFIYDTGKGDDDGRNRRR